jgi:hypothetical protein
MSNLKPFSDLRRFAQQSSIHRLRALRQSL